MHSNWFIHNDNSKLPVIKTINKLNGHQHIDTIHNLFDKCDGNQTFTYIANLKCRPKIKFRFRNTNTQINDS